jgi:hypothetical protein
MSTLIINGQCLFDDANLPSNSGAKVTSSAKNGWFLSTTGEIRLLVIYVDIIYDITGVGHFPNGSSAWNVGQLPNYKDDLFDLNWTGNPQGKITQYFAECSLDSYKVLGDYLDTLITVKESDMGSVTAYNIHQQVLMKVNQLGMLYTHGGSTMIDLDN